MKSEMTALSVYGLEDLIAGKTPSLSGWTVDPTDTVKITDGDPATVCTTGNKVLGGGFQYAYIDWDLGSFYNILASGVGSVIATAGSPRYYLKFWDGAAWIGCTTYSVYGGADALFGHTYSGMCSKIRIALTSSAAATITPNIREFHVWRLK